MKEFWPKDTMDKANRQISEYENIAMSKIAGLRIYKKLANKQQKRLQWKKAAGVMSNLQMRETMRA